jgi:hypothetical protein
VDYWFPVKPSGLGWGPPTKWQGWTFLIGWIALLLSGSKVLDTSTSALVFFAGMIAILSLVIFFKAEPRRLR